MKTYDSTGPRGVRYRHSRCLTAGGATEDFHLHRHIGLSTRLRSAGWWFDRYSDQFFSQNKLHLTAHELADFELVASIPIYLSFAFGFIRDIWSPFGMGDRGFMLLFGASTAGLYVFFAFTPVSSSMLLVESVLLTTSFLFVASAQNGLASTIGKQHVISGQISAVWNIFMSIPIIAALLLGGRLAPCSKAKMPSKPSASSFSVVPQSWPWLPLTPHIDQKAYSTTFIVSIWPPLSR